MVRAATLLLLVVAVVYGRALGFGFTYDDRALIELNAALGDLSTLPQALLRDLFFHAEGVRTSPYWRPVVTLSYYADYWLSGGRSAGFHLNNLLMLWGASLGLWKVLQSRWGDQQALAWALLFAVHPAQVEAATNIAARTDLYCVAFGIWGLLLAKSRPVLSLGMVLAACGSKEVGLVFPLVYWAWWGRGRYSWKAPAVGVIGFLAVRWALVSQWDIEAGGMSWEAWCHAGSRTVALFAQLLAPIPVAYGSLMGESSPWAMAGGWALVIGAGWLGWRRRLQAPGLAAGTVLMIVPVLIAMVASPVAPRVSQGFLVLPVLGLVFALQVWFQERRSVFLPLCGIVVVLALTSGSRVGIWKTDTTLFETSHAQSPDDPNVALNLARSVVLENPKRSLALLEGVEPTGERRKREAAAVRARALLSLDRQEEALGWLKRAAATETESAWAVGTLCVLLAGGEDEQSEKSCQVAVALLPDDPDVANAMGIVYAHGGDLANAGSWFGKAVSLEPSRKAFQANLEAASSTMQVR